MFITLKPLAERKDTADKIITRLRPKLGRIPGATLYLQANQDLRVGGRNSNAQYQYTLQGDNLPDLTAFVPGMLSEMKNIPILTDVSLDLQNRGLQAGLQYDRATAARFGITPQLIDNTLYDAFGQRPVSTMYTAMNQYHVVMEVDPRFWQSPQFLDQIYVTFAANGGSPLSVFTHYTAATTPLAVNHHGLFPAVTLSFNLRPGAALGEAVDAISRGRGASLHAAHPAPYICRNRRAYQDSLASEPL